MNKRKQWFIDRIGKKVFRNYHKCCEHCDKVYNEGLVIADRMHANYLYDVEVEFTMEGNPTHYFDTKEEVIEYEKTLKK